MISTLRIVVLIFVFFIIPNSIASTDIFISQISQANTEVNFSPAKNVTNRPGYDNQPYFSKDGTILYFTSQLETQTDLMSLNLVDLTLINLTQTQETSEYSPTLFNDEKNLSFVKVETDGTQRLWQLAMGQKKQTLVNTTIKPVGYHAWGANQDLALFVLGEPMMLQYINSATQSSGNVVAKEIGRTLRYNPKLSSFTFTRTQANMLTAFSPQTAKLKDITPLLGGTEDYTWLDDDTVVVAKGSELYGYNIVDDSPKWRQLADFSAQCPTLITRLAVDEKRRTLAFVCNE